MNINKFLMFLFFIGFYSCCNSQSLKKIKSMETNYQNCLDNGVNMKKCAENYYLQIDALLNEVYKKSRLKINQKEKDRLKSEQLKWIKNRDLYFKKAYAEAKDEAEDLSKEDIEMVFIDKKAEYVKERVLYLIKKFKV